MKKNKLIQSIAMGILSFSLLSNNFMVYATDGVLQQEEEIEAAVEESSGEQNIDSNQNETSNDENLNIQTLEDGTTIINYHEEITEIPTEKEKDQIVEEKTQEQEEIKQDIVDQDGTYDYTITVETITLEKKTTEEVDNAAEASSFANEVDGTVETEIINSTEGSTTAIVSSEEEIDEVVEEIAAASASDTSASNNIERQIVNVETEEVNGVSADQVDEKGYHIDENEDGSFTIVVTGGLEEIEIDFAWFSSTQLMYPGDKINASFTIVNESGDKYEVTGYEKKTDGPYRYSLTTNFNEEWGTPATTFTDSRGREYTAYIPNEILKVNGRDIDRATLEIMFKEYADKTMRERREIAANLTEDDLLNYYNEQMGTSYENVFEAWQANLNNRLWTTTYTKDGEEENYGEDFWTSVDLTTNTPVDFTMTASLDGLGTDNLYQMTVWDFIELLKIKAIPIIAVTVDYVDNELKYTVNYTVEETNYTVEVDGNGYISKKVEPEPDPIIEPEPEVKPNPIPEKPEPEIIPAQPEIPIIVPSNPIPTIDEVNEEPSSSEETETITIEETVIPLSNEPTPTVEEDKEVLGAQKSTQPVKQVLGARKAKTNDNNSIAKRAIVIIGCIALLFLLLFVDTSIGNKEN